MQNIIMVKYIKANLKCYSLELLEVKDKHMFRLIINKHLNRVLT